MLNVKASPPSHRHLQSYTKAGRTFSQEQHHHYFGQTVKILEDEQRHTLSTGIEMWDPQLLLLRKLERSYRPSFFRDLRVLQVGAGCGLIGIMLALLGAKVTMVESKTQSSQRVKENIDLNFSSSSQLSRKQPSVVPLSEPTDPNGFDLVIGVDVVDKALACSPLATTMASSLTDSAGSFGLLAISSSVWNLQTETEFEKKAHELGLTVNQTEIDSRDKPHFKSLLGRDFNILQVKAQQVS
jgi:predicted RNA methylase